LTVRRVVLVALVTGTLIFLYFDVPILGLAAGLALVGAVIAWQIRAVVRSPHPWLRATVVLGLSFPVLILAFASAYVLISRADPSAFSERLSHLSGLYLTMTVFTTVGFGDIVAVTPPARIVVLVQMLLDLVYLGFAVRALTAAARLGVERRARDRDAG